MNPETYAWMALREHAANRLSPGFAERTLRAAREAVPTVFSQILLSAATAGACLLVAFAINARMNDNEAARNLADWQAVAAEADQVAMLR